MLQTIWAKPPRFQKPRRFKLVVQVPAFVPMGRWDSKDLGDWQAATGNKQVR
jgi:hypothetical protein